MKNGVWFPEDGDSCYKTGWMGDWVGEWVMDGWIVAELETWFNRKDLAINAAKTGVMLVHNNHIFYKTFSYF
jgi:hypothetical protein